ncbi:hypothetical protein [Winogradskyella bathintestinalis]|uniref:Uncharacterized protein n=1 Tax=Winogradskyella bathintestinalis TaxID=3035208 RepID=A0ABT7ZWI7_9FLAO|nr:hypothetical protein [Winogradskyella bathintestinalis]MDN3493194.1 hypothetical protein [Winogradskyella bathintestinalis]
MSKRNILITFFLVILVIVLSIYWSVASTDKITSKSVLYNIENAETTNFRTYDSVELLPSDLYKADDVKKVIQGEQYRAAWSAKIKVPIVFLDTLKGGMTMVEKGGGKQTHSLEMLGADGITYTLRSVNKDAKLLIPEFLKSLKLENIVVDGISAQHPFAAILAAELAEKAHVLHTSPRMLFIPKQERLAHYNTDFGNKLYLLEYETKSEVNYTTLKNVQDIIDTDNLQELKLQLKDSLHIDARALVRSRLFDMLIGDWDRHTKQWGWAIQKTEREYTAIPVAGDRDNAFFKTDGLIPTLIANRHVVKELRSFEKDIDFMEGLVYPFDNYFLSQTPESIFIEEAEKLQSRLTDSVLNAALNVWPQNIRDLDGADIVLKIKERRDDLKEYAIQFYKIIQKKGKVTKPLKGSEDLELSNDFIGCFECG